MKKNLIEKSTPQVVPEISAAAIAHVNFIGNRIQKSAWLNGSVFGLWIQTYLGLNTALSITTSATTDNLCNLSKPQVSHLKNKWYLLEELL